MAPVTEGAAIDGLRNERSAETRLRADIAELLFCIEARKRGYRVRLLGGNCQGYDVILEKDDMRPLFVQVKHGFLLTNVRQNRNCQYYKIPNTTGGSGCAYGPHSYDVLAFYMWDRKQWLLFRRCEFGSRKGVCWVPPEIRQRARNTTAKLDDRNPDNWLLLDQVAAIRSQESFGLGQPMSDPMPNTP
jgi:hypothetical protein